MKCPCENCATLAGALSAAQAQVAALTQERQGWTLAKDAAMQAQAKQLEALREEIEGVKLCREMERQRAVKAEAEAVTMREDKAKWQNTAEHARLEILTLRGERDKYGERCLYLSGEIAALREELAEAKKERALDNGCGDAAFNLMKTRAESAESKLAAMEKERDKEKRWKKNVEEQRAAFAARAEHDRLALAAQSAALEKAREALEKNLSDCRREEHDKIARIEATCRAVLASLPPPPEAPAEENTNG